MLHYNTEQAARDLPFPISKKTNQFKVTRAVLTLGSDNAQQGRPWASADTEAGSIDRGRPPSLVLSHLFPPPTENRRQPPASCSGLYLDYVCVLNMHANGRDAD